jgi:hypothetical protein
MLPPLVVLLYLMQSMSTALHPVLYHPAEFIQLLSSEANELAMGDNKSTITPEHVVRALQQLGFEEWADDVKHSHEQFKAEAKREWLTAAAVVIASCDMLVSTAAAAGALAGCRRGHAKRRVVHDAGHNTRMQG